MTFLNSDCLKNFSLENRLLGFGERNYEYNYYPINDD